MKSEPVWGRDTVLVLTINNTTVNKIGSIESFEGKFLVATVKKQYLGQTGPKYDYIYDGFEGSIRFDADDDEILSLYAQLIEGAGDRTKQVKLNITSAFKFSTGRIKKYQLINCAYGDLPLGSSGRDKFLEGGLDIKCGNPPIFL